MRMGMFKKGYEAVQEEKQRQDEAQEKAGKNLFNFFLKDDGDEADVRFLTEEPVTFYEHTLKLTRNGKETYESHLCSQDDNCPYCQNDDKPSFKGAYLVFDTRSFKAKDKDGKEKTVKGSVKLYKQGARVLSQLGRISAKYGLTNRPVTIVRLGKGTQTTYTIERGDEDGKLSESEIRNMLPEKLREDYNGTEESLTHIIENCLSNSLNETGHSSSHSESNDSEDDDSEYKSRKNLVNVDADEDEEEESPAPKMHSVKKHGALKRKPMFKNSSRQENSVKPLFHKVK